MPPMPVRTSDLRGIGVHWDRREIGGRPVPQDRAGGWPSQEPPDRLERQESPDQLQSRDRRDRRGTQGLLELAYWFQMRLPVQLDPRDCFRIPVQPVRLVAREPREVWVQRESLAIREPQDRQARRVQPDPRATQDVREHVVRVVRQERRERRV